MNDKERHALERIVSYCERAETARQKHFRTRGEFDEDEFYGDGIALYIQQVGECVRDLSDEFIGRHDEVPWHQMRGMRNIIAHEYEGVDHDVVWEVLTQDLPALKVQVEELLAQR